MFEHVMTSNFPQRATQLPKYFDLLVPFLLAHVLVMAPKGSPFFSVSELGK